MFIQLPESSHAYPHLPKSRLEIRADVMVRTTAAGQVVEHRFKRMSGVTFTIGNNLAVPGIALVLLSGAALAFVFVPIRWLAWVTLVITVAFASFFMLGMRVPLLIFHEEGVRFRYPLIGSSEEVGAFEVAVRRAISSGDA